MIDNSQVLNNAFQYFKSFESIHLLNSEEKNKLEIHENTIAWKLITEVESANGELLEIELIVVFMSDFPLSIPKIYVSAKDFDLIKFLPHVDSNRLICTFDSETTRSNPDNPNGIIFDCIKKAKKIISDGLCEANLKDYDDEFNSYWQRVYGKKDAVLHNVLSILIESPTSSEIKLTILNIPISTYKYIIHQEDTESIRFLNFLRERNYKFETISAFYIGDLSLGNPPYILTNKNVLSIASVNSQKLKSFIKFINSPSRNKFVLGKVFKGDSEHFLGWFHRKFDVKRNGFRHHSIKNFDALRKYQSSELVIRVAPEIFTNKRLSLRTVGNFDSTKKKFTIAGVGSIGSNLVYFLNTINSPEFLLIDPDILTIENINRHFLGFTDVGKYKAKALASFLQSQNPLQKISSINDSIISVCTDQIEVINDSDYIFVLTGKTNVDTWLCNALEEGLITKPMFLLWVEPYLAGGHCIFLNPHSKNYQKLFDEDNYFFFNVIKKSEYLNPINSLILREPGCQNSFSPYSVNNVINFLSEVFHQISRIIFESFNQDRAFTYIGNLDEIKSLKIETSINYSKISNGTLIEHNINGN